MFNLFKRKNLIIYTNNTCLDYIDVTNIATMRDIDKKIVKKYGCNLYSYTLLGGLDPVLKIGITNSSNEKPKFYLCSISFKNINTKNECYNLKFLKKRK